MSIEPGPFVDYQSLFRLYVLKNGYSTHRAGVAIYGLKRASIKFILPNPVVNGINLVNGYGEVALEIGTAREQAICK